MDLGIWVTELGMWVTGYELSTHSGARFLTPHLDFSSTSDHLMHARLALSHGIGFGSPMNLMAQLYIVCIGVHQVDPKHFLEVCPTAFLILVQKCLLNFLNRLEGY